MVIPSIHNGRLLLLLYFLSEDTYVIKSSISSFLANKILLYVNLNVSKSGSYSPDFHAPKRYTKSDGYISPPQPLWSKVPCFLDWIYAKSILDYRCFLICHILPAHNQSPEHTVSRTIHACCIHYKDSAMLSGQKPKPWIV